ncbi:uncharacterized protein LOC103500260 isoform X2 [Cucumis melo]|uniref:Uncharacterized protein LOC103500260 isoform X2 n=1 Tax=Cucumis melo TaxID=3656 RepID=A0ABM3KDV0_CUCME|nr:uncharacterized protein LOC103500260 isoform X2 [Cucumis melo]
MQYKLHLKKHEISKLSFLDKGGKRVLKQTSTATSPNSCYRSGEQGHFALMSVQVPPRLCDRLICWFIDLKMISMFLGYLRNCGKKILVVDVLLFNYIWEKLSLSYAMKLQHRHGAVKRNLHKQCPNFVKF